MRKLYQEHLQKKYRCKNKRYTLYYLIAESYDVSKFSMTILSKLAECFNTITTQLDDVSIFTEMLVKNKLIYIMLSFSSYYEFIPHDLLWKKYFTNLFGFANLIFERKKVYEKNEELSSKINDYLANILDLLCHLLK